MWKQFGPRQDGEFATSQRSQRAGHRFRDFVPERHSTQLAVDGGPNVTWQGTVTLLVTVPSMAFNAQKVCPGYWQLVVMPEYAATDMQSLDCQA